MRVESICLGTDRKFPKHPLEKANLEPGGVVGDGHFGLSEREVSMLRLEDVRSAEKKAGFSFPPGSLAENLVVSGLPENLGLRSLLVIGSARLLVVERGKKKSEPHTYSYRGWCLLPEVGYFLKVLKGGEISPKDEVKLIVSSETCDKP